MQGLDGLPFVEVFHGKVCHPSPACNSALSQGGRGVPQPFSRATRGVGGAQWHAWRAAKETCPRATMRGAHEEGGQHEHRNKGWVVSVGAGGSGKGVGPSHKRTFCH